MSASSYWWGELPDAALLIGSSYPAPLAITGFMSCVQLCLPAVQITWIFFFSVVLLYNAAAQLQECEKCKKPGSRLAVREGCTSPPVPPKQIWPLFSKYDHVLR